MLPFGLLLLYLRQLVQTKTNKSLRQGHISIKFKFILTIYNCKSGSMQEFIVVQNVLINPNKSFQHFKSQLIKSQINQFTYLCLLLNIAATIKRPDFNFKVYLDFVINYKDDPGFRSSCINYTGYKDKVSILMNACEKSIAPTISALAYHPQIKLYAVDPNGLNAVFYAVRNPDQNQGLKILQVFKDISPQIIDSVTSNGFSPLFLAVQKFRPKIVDFLLSHQVDPNQRLANNGNTAMHQLVRISSKHSFQQVRKMIQVFLRHGFDLSLRNGLERTVQQYAFDFRFNIMEIVTQIKSNKNYSEYSYGSQTEAWSSKIATNKIGDVFTNYNYSEVEGSDFNELDGISVSDKSLLSEVNHIRHTEEKQKQFSVDMNVKPINKDQVDNSQLQETQRKMECHSHSDNPKSQYPLGQNQNEQQVGDSQSLSGSSSSNASQGQYLRMQEIDYERIQKQIVQFDQESQGMYSSAWRQIQPFFIKLNQIVEPLGLAIQLIGTFATGLWTHHSDIDIALITLNQNFIDFQKVLQKVHGKLKTRMYEMGIKQLSLKKVSKIPSIKIQMEPHLYSSRKIDIMVFHKKNMGITYVNYISQAMASYNQIRPLFFFLKRICQQFGLHDPFNGGMKSYSIFLMVYSMVKTLQSINLGQILLKITLYYGFYHQYNYDIQYRTTQFGKEPFPVLKLNIPDPLNTKNNMGGINTDTCKVKNMFRTIYYGLHTEITNGTNLQHILELAQITL